MNDMDDLEYRLWLLQGEVNQAMQNIGQSDPVDSERLHHMETEIAYLQQQVARLRGLGQVQLQPRCNSLPTAPPRPLPFGQPFPVGQKLPLPQGQPSPYGQPYPPGQPLPSKAPEKKDLEKTLGTGMMGIAASVLVFISIIIFGGLLLPYLTDTVMTVIMFLLSFALFGAGYLLLRKDPKNRFHISLCACGMTAVCVSLFVTRQYFELIGDAVFLALIVLWLLLAVFMSRKYQNYLFRIIGEIGIFLTVCLGSGRLASADMAAGDWFMFCVLLLVFGGSTVIFQTVIPRESYEKNAFSHVIRTLIFALLPFVFAGEEGTGIGVYAGFAFVAALLIAEICLAYREVLSDGCLFYILTGADALLFCVILCMTFQLDSALPYYIMSVLTAGFFERKKSKNSVIGNAVACLFFLGSGWAWLHASVFYAALVMLPLFAYGYVKKNTAPLYVGLFCIVGIFGADGMAADVFPGSNFLFLWAVPFLCFVVLARVRKDQIFTASGYPAFMACGVWMFAGLLSEFGVSANESVIIVFLAAAVSHMLFIKGRVFAEERTGFETVAAVMTLFLMAYGAYAVYQEYLNVVTMLVMAALFTMNTVNLLKRSENFGYYIGFKYTVLMILLVDSHFEFSMLISVLMLLFAAGSIVFGFYKNYKSFRVYGLILSMVSIFKLVLFDVTNKSALYNAVGFLVCGLICFGISFLYNKIENRVKKK